MSRSQMPTAPRVRIVVLNWNSSWITRACLSSLEATKYPREQLEIVVVDNASHDGSLEHIQSQFPNVEIIRNSTNLGFAEACNIGMRHPGTYDYIALVNNDATVDPDWLSPLVEALEANNQAGAAAPLLLLDPPMIKVHVNTSAPIQLESVELDGEDITDRTHYRGVQEVGDPAWPFRLTRHFDGPATLFIPAPRVARDDAEPMMTVRVVGDGHLSMDAESMHLDVRIQGPTRLMFAAPQERTTLVNGLGTILNNVGEAADLGYGEELEQFHASKLLDRHSELGVCGGGVLFRSSMLDDIGLFDPKLFAYYEDIDLSWRARRAGWKITAVSESHIEHQFGGSAGSTSPMFFHLYYRNWLITVLRNASGEMIFNAFTHVFKRYWWAVKYNILSAIRHWDRFSLDLPKAWTSVLVGVAVLAPRTLAQRYSKRLRHRIGRHKSTRVYSLAQPLSTSRPPQQRIGGPDLVHVVINPPDKGGALDRNSIKLLKAALKDPQLDVVVVEPVPHRTDQFQLLTPTQWAHLLDVPGPTLPVKDNDPRRLATGLHTGQRPLTLEELGNRLTNDR